jgi:plastocyanin
MTAIAQLRFHPSTGLKQTIRRRALFLYALVFISFPLARAQGQAVIEGTVKLPAPVAGPVESSRYQIKGKGPATAPDPPVAVVYLEGELPEPVVTNVPPTVELEQKNFHFHPAVLPIQRGTAVKFPNRDDEYHNVLSYSKAKEFDLGRYRKDEKGPSVIFEKPGLVELNCEIHEHMRGFILVLDTPYFTPTDADGKFRLEQLPAGTYTLKAWLNEKTVWQQPVTLKAGETNRVEFTGK